MYVNYLVCACSVSRAKTLFNKSLGPWLARGRLSGKKTRASRGSLLMYNPIRTLYMESEGSKLQQKCNKVDIETNYPPCQLQTELNKARDFEWLLCLIEPWVFDLRRDRKFGEHFSQAKLNLSRRFHIRKINKQAMLFTILLGPHQCDVIMLYSSKKPVARRLILSWISWEAVGRKKEGSCKAECVLS